jgi:hypothetical protein
MLSLGVKFMAGHVRSMFFGITPITSFLNNQQPQTPGGAYIMCSFWESRDAGSMNQHEPTIICRLTLHSCRLLSSQNFRKNYRTPFYVELSKPGFRRLKYVQEKQIHARIFG